MNRLRLSIKLVIGLTILVAISSIMVVFTYINIQKIQTGLAAFSISDPQVYKALMQTTNDIQTGMVILGIIADISGILIGFFLIPAIIKPINRIVGSLNDTVQQVVAASQQLSASAQQLSDGSAQQASSIEEATACLHESASMLQQNASNTTQAVQLSELTNESALKGNREMTEMMNSMEEIKKSSNEISKIIKVIDDISFQTNILALNAAIEAARAGETGLGFAVVAEEVRNLAGRSTQAAQNTNAIIDSNIVTSIQGYQVAERVRDVLNEIMVQAKKVKELLEEISAASREQAFSVEQVNEAMVQVESIVQQNSANAEENAASAEELSAQAENMKQIVYQLTQLIHGASKSSKKRHA